jgi:hypothetical protein
MNRLARALLAAVLLAALVDYGGAGDLVRPGLAIALAAVLLLVASGMRGESRTPEIGWIPWLFLPLMALPVLQALPLGWHHPWVTADLAVLDTTHATWSIEPAATVEAAVWLATLAGIALAVTVLARGERARYLGEALVGTAAATALAGLAFVLAGVEWPVPHSTTLARGPFIYPNHAAAFWAAVLPLALLGAHRRPSPARWGAVAVLALAILLSGSRGGIMVATAVVLPLVATLLPRQRRWWWAGGLAIGLAGWIWFIGLAEVADKFGRLRGAEGVTLNGRVLIWQAAWPVIADAGALGSGAGTTTVAYRRSGDPHFADVVVNHLHSDPLEWWLEYGWVGVLVGITVLIVVLRRLRPATGDDAPDDEQRRLHRGAALGLLVLALHGCGDFIWHNPAVAVEGVLLLTLVASTRQRRPRRPAPTHRLRSACAASALVLAIGAWPAWQWTMAELVARDAERLLVARRAAHLSLEGATVLDRAQALQPESVRLAVMQAWLGRAAMEPDRTREALAAAAHLAPGDAAAWGERALAASDAGRLDAMTVALHRGLAWAPAWPDLQSTALRLVALHGEAALPRAEAIRIIEALLVVDRPQPAWFFPLAARIIGADALARRLDDAGPTLNAAGERWLAQDGPLAQWSTLRRRLATAPPRLAAALGPAAEHLYGADGWHPILPLTAEERRALAEVLHQSALPLPSALATLLIADGPPWARWIRPVDLLDPLARDELQRLLRTELHRAWARGWSDRCGLAARALDGDATVVDRDSDPRILACLAGELDDHPAPPSIAAGERQRARQLLSRWREWDWQDLPGAGRWSWWYGDGSGNAWIDAPAWSGLVIDGTWTGWIRGRHDLAPLLGQGLHRVVVLTP